MITRFHSFLILETTHFLWPPIPIHALKLRPNHTLLEDISGGFCSVGRLQGFEPESFTSHGFAKKYVVLVVHSLGTTILEVFTGDYTWGYA